MASTKTICIAGASGLVGANLTRHGLQAGYQVRGTLRNADDPNKAPHLSKLPGAAQQLSLHSADMSNPGDFDNIVQGVDAVFIACLIPTYAGPSGKPAREMDDDQGHREIVMPTVDGCLNILRSAAQAGVRDVLICSSTSSTNPNPPVAFKNEVDHWSDPQVQYAQKKYTSAAKTVMEHAAMEFADTHNMRLSIFLPTLMLGPAVIPLHNTLGFQGMLQQMLAGQPSRYRQLPNNSSSMIHVQDLAALFFAALENPQARGRYFGVYESWHLNDLFAELHKLMPQALMPTPFEGEPDPPTGFDFTRRDSLGVKLRNIPEILADTVNYLRQAGTP